MHGADRGEAELGFDPIVEDSGGKSRLQSRGLGSFEFAFAPDEDGLPPLFVFLIFASYTQPSLQYITIALVLPLYWLHISQTVWNQSIFLLAIR
jgi:hypothetical protein